jgi:hypothetical protein
MSEREALCKFRPSALTEEQVVYLMHRAHRGEIAAFSAGIGSNGHPAGPDAWVMLTNGKSYWLTPEGAERPA